MSKLKGQWFLAKAEKAWTNGKYQKMIEYCEKAIAEEYGEAAYFLYRRYEDGNAFYLGKINPFPADSQKALHYLEIAVKLRHPMALIAMGEMYMNGEHYPKNLDKAATLFSVAAKQGYKMAQDLLLECQAMKNPVKASTQTASGQTASASKATQAEGKKQTQAPPPKKEETTQKPPYVLPKSYCIFPPKSSAKVDSVYQGACDCLYAGFHKEAFKNFKLLAKAGQAKGYNGLGVCYLDGLGCKQNRDKAVACFLEGAERGYASAQYNLARCYEREMHDYDKALTWYTKAAKQGHLDAQYALAGFYYYVYKDEEQAFEWYERAANAGHTKAQCGMAEIYEKGMLNVEKNWNLALYWYQKAADSENGFAQFKLGNFYFYGIEVKADITTAAQWYQRGAKNGDMYAAYNLGFCYLVGKGVPKNTAQALAFNQKAAEQNHSGAMERVCYLSLPKSEVIDVKPENPSAEFPQMDDAKWQLYLKAGKYRREGNYIEAVNIYNTLAKQGYGAGYDGLSICFENGQGLEQDSQKALTYLKEGVRRGCMVSQVKLAMMYESEGNNPKSLYKAAQLYANAAAQGEVVGQYRLAQCYYYGIGVTQNYAKAGYWYNEASKKGHPDATFELGKCMMSGHGTLQCFYLGEQYIRKAAELGSEAAQFELDYVFDGAPDVMYFDDNPLSRI